MDFFHILQPQFDGMEEVGEVEPSNTFFVEGVGSSLGIAFGHEAR